ncbi:protein YLS3 [Sesamum alatum]|uniref:Protein YLS3 n=1 Tax=Sesamum alatum TaxID=300844 RepID=A0AAE1YPD0_9LAMI|nr:protein YLS3 [Sesamum alatum]
MKFLTVACIIAMWATVAAAATSGGPDPASDCNTLIYDMIDCMPFLTNGGHQTKPEDSCCSGVKNVVETDADCVCFAVNSAIGLGLDINMTRAEGLPSRCGVFTPPLSSCIASSTPGPSPAKPPKASGAPSHSPNLPPPTARPPPAAASSAPPRAAPAPSPQSSGAYKISAIFSVIFTIILFLVL